AGTSPMMRASSSSRSGCACLSNSLNAWAASASPSIRTDPERSADSGVGPARRNSANGEPDRAALAGASLCVSIVSVSPCTVKYRLSDAPVTWRASTLPSIRLHVARAAADAAILRLSRDSRAVSRMPARCSQPPAAVQRHDAAAQIVVAAVLEPGFAHHREQLLLSREAADRLG